MPFEIHRLRFLRLKKRSPIEALRDKVEEGAKLKFLRLKKRSPIEAHRSWRLKDIVRRYFCAWKSAAPLKLRIDDWSDFPAALQISALEKAQPHWSLYDIIFSFLYWIWISALEKAQPHWSLFITIIYSYNLFISALEKAQPHWSIFYHTQHFVCDFLFLRLKKRSPIEACRYFAVFVLHARVFLRLKKRSPIEALPFAGFTDLQQNFCAWKSAAPLKRHY